MATVSENVCPSCGGTELEEDSAHGVVACVRCGSTVECQLTQGQELSQMPTSTAQHPRSQGPSKQQIRVFSDKQYAAKKQAKVVKQTMKVAETMKLPQAKATICVEHAKELAKRHAIGGKGLSIEHVSAALVFIAWKNENVCVSAHDMVNTGIKPSTIVRVANRLCKDHPDLLSITQSEPLSDEERLTLRLDRFSMVAREERKKVLQVALEIWSMLMNVRVQGVHIRKVPINDYTILAVALQYIRREGLNTSEKTDLAEKISMTRQTIQTRLWLIRKALLTLAARCPCLGEDVKNRVITTHNVHRYLDRLIQNKKYLISEVELMNTEEAAGGEDEEREAAEDDESSPKRKRAKVQRKRVKKSRVHDSTVPIVLANGEASLVGEEEEDKEVKLSDLDDDELDEYILTETEVEMRRHLLSSAQQPPEHSLSDQR